MNSQYQLVRQFIANAKQRGYGIYAGKSFAVATIERGKRVEIRIDRNMKAKERR